MLVNNIDLTKHRFWLAVVRAPFLNGAREFQATNEKRSKFSRCVRRKLILISEIKFVYHTWKVGKALEIELFWMLCERTFVQFKGSIQYLIPQAGKRRNFLDMMEKREIHKEKEAPNDVIFENKYGVEFRKLFQLQLTIFS